MKIEIGQVISQIIAFLIMYFVLKRYAWKPILAVMEERKKRIQSDFDSIERQKRELAQAESSSKQRTKASEMQAFEMVQNALEKGKRVAAELQKNAQDEAKQILKKARMDADQEVVKAKAQLKNELVTLTIAATEKVLQSSLDQEQQKKIAEDFVNKIGV